MWNTHTKCHELNIRWDTDAPCPTHPGTFRVFLRPWVGAAGGSFSDNWEIWPRYSNVSNTATPSLI